MQLAKIVTGGSIIPTKPEGVKWTEPSEIISTIFTVVIVVASAIFVILLLIGGIQYLTAAGNEEATTKAKRLLVDAVVGLIIVLAAWALGTWVLGQLGVSS